MKLSEIADGGAAAPTRIKLSDIPADGPKASTGVGLFRPIEELGGAIAQDYESGDREYREGLHQLVSNTSYPSALGGLVKMFGGALEAAGSPITGTGREVIGKPVEQTLTAVGVGPKTSRIISQYPETLAEVFAPGGITKGIAAIREAPRVAAEVTTEAKAIKKVLQRFVEDSKAGGMTAEEALKHIDQARALGKPMTLADAGGSNVQGLAGNVTRAPGTAREFSRKFLNDRDAGASKRLTADVSKYLATGSVRQTAEALAASRSAEGKPLFEEAYRGGSMAPLEKQFADEFKQASDAVADATKKASAAIDRWTKARDISRTLPDLNKGELTAAERDLQKWEQVLKDAQKDRADTLERLRGAQADRTAGAPGAVWNPRIQRLLDLPIVKSGIAKGMQLERQNAAAEGRAINNSEYAIVGADEAGNPIVGKVPNMRLLASAKEGLDAILGSPGMRDELTGRLTKEGVSVDKVRRALLGELDKANPAYKAARASWAGHSQAMEALRYGRTVFREKPEDIAAEVAQMSASEREFAKLGVADALREKILRTGFGGDEAKAIIRSDWVKEQLRPLFKTDADFTKFVDSVTAERKMFETKQRLTGGSQTAERQAEDFSDHAQRGVEAVKMVGHAASGNWLSAIQSMIRMRRDLGLRVNPELNNAIAQLLFDPTISFDRLNLSAPAAVGPAAAGGAAANEGVAKLTSSIAEGAAAKDAENAKRAIYGPKWEQMRATKPPAKGLAPANRYGDGTVVYGKPGETHGDIPGPVHDVEAGFAGPDGKFLTRDEALAKLAREDPRNPALQSPRLPFTGFLDARDLGQPPP